MTENIEDQELTLMHSGGVFVKMRKPNVLDIWRSQSKSGNDIMKFMLLVISEICLFDGQKWTYEQVLEMDPFDCALLVKEYSKRYTRKS